MTTNSFTFGGKFLIPNPTISTILLQKLTGGVGYQAEIVVTTGYLKVTLNALTFTTTVAPSITAGTWHDFAFDVTVGATQTTVSFKVDGAILETPAAQNNTTSLANAANLYILGTSAARYAGGVCKVIIDNYAVTSYLDRYRNGIAESDKWGSQSNLITDGDFSLGGATWIKSAGVTVVDQGAGDYEAVLAAVAVGHALYKDSILTAGVKYRITFTITNMASGEVRAYVGGTQGIARTSSGTYTEDLTASVSGYTTRVGIYVSVAATCRIDDISVVKVGATLALEPEGIQPAPGQWLDSSTNKLHAMQPAVGSSLTRKKESFEVRWTNTWAGTHEAQYVGGINQAVLPPNCYIESIIGVVSGTVIEDIILGDGVDVDRWVTITTGLATGTQTFAIANRVSDGTNRKLVVDPDANFTGSISWILKGIIL